MARAAAFEVSPVRETTTTPSTTFSSTVVELDPLALARASARRSTSGGSACAGATRPRPTLPRSASSARARGTSRCRSRSRSARERRSSSPGATRRGCGSKPSTPRHPGVDRLIADRLGRPRQWRGRALRRARRPCRHGACPAARSSRQTTTVTRSQPSSLRPACARTRNASSSVGASLTAIAASMRSR